MPAELEKLELVFHGNGNCHRLLEAEAGAIPCEV